MLWGSYNFHIKQDLLSYCWLAPHAPLGRWPTQHQAGSDAALIPSQLTIPFWTPLHRQHTLRTSASSFWQNHLSFQMLLLHMWNEWSLKLALSVCNLISAVQLIKKLCVLRQYRELEGTGKLILSNHQQKQSCKAAHSARKRAQPGCIGRLQAVFQEGFICITVHFKLL